MTMVIHVGVRPGPMAPKRRHALRKYCAPAPTHEAAAAKIAEAKAFNGKKMTPNSTQMRKSVYLQRHDHAGFDVTNHIDPLGSALGTDLQGNRSSETARNRFLRASLVKSMSRS